MNNITLIPIPERDRFGREIPKWRREEIARLRADFVNPEKAVVREGVRYWRISDGTERVIPSCVFEDAYVECPEVHKAAEDAETARIIAEHKAYRAEHGYSEEELFEMRAAFGPGEEVVNVLTGEKIKL